MFCPKCGKEFIEEENFCSNCGSSLLDPNAAAQSNAVPTIETTNVALFAFFLGYFGIHDFLLERPGRGISKIILGLVGAFTFIPIFPLMIWIMVDLYHIWKQTYPTTKKRLIGSTNSAKMLFILYLVIGIFGMVCTIAAIALFFAIGSQLE